MPFDMTFKCSKKLQIKVTTPQTKPTQQVMVQRKMNALKAVNLQTKTQKPLI